MAVRTEEDKGEEGEEDTEEEDVVGTTLEGIGEGQGRAVLRITGVFVHAQLACGKRTLNFFRSQKTLHGIKEEGEKKRKEQKE